MKQNWLEFWVGIFVVAAIAALVFLAVSVANQTRINKAESYHVDASFTNIGGLKVRSPVKSAGVTVGRVTNISLNTQNYQAVVTFSIEKDFPFSTDTSAAILTSGLLGEQYISLEAGSDPDMLGEGDSISYTSSAMILENLIGKFLLSGGSSN